MHVPIYQLSMSQSPREQTENKSVLCTSHYKAVGTFPPTAAPPPPPHLEIYTNFQFAVDSRSVCPPGRDVPLSGVLHLGRGSGGGGRKVPHLAVEQNPRPPQCSQA